MNAQPGRSRPGRPLPAPEAFIGMSTRRSPPSQAGIARRRWLIAAVKRLLPVLAVALLASVALWPEFTRQIDQHRLHLATSAPGVQTGQLRRVSYHGTDERNRPYTVTATQAIESSSGRVDMVDPKGDLALEGGRWLLVQAKRGVYVQHVGNLDLSGDVQLYRDDGTIMQTNSANLDLKAGAGSGTEQVHIEGPFGTIDAQGFTMTDRGGALSFAGPGRLVLNSRKP